VSAELLVAAAYAAALTGGAFVLEWLSAHTHRRALRFTTAGFTYSADRDHWTCPEGEHLWPTGIDHERRLARYRARAHVCNGCSIKHRCTDSDRGREITRPLDPWPHSEAGRFHRVIALTMVGLAALIVCAEGVRRHEPRELAVLLPLLAAIALAARYLLRDLRAHPARFPSPARNGDPVSRGVPTR
jgi:hypothetical protein